MMEIRYLTGEEKQASRSLYECCFPEDTEKFTDYYYKEKCRDNRIAAVKVQKNGMGEQIAVMVHENPYTMSICGNPALVSYIVAVATHPDYRRRGWMKKVLAYSLRQCYRREEPFSFLTPADPAYYESLGYRFWKNQQEWIVEGELPEGTPAVNENAAELAAFSNQVLSEHFDLYVQRDEAYYRRLIREQKSGDGDIVILWKKKSTGGKTVDGCFCYSLEDGMEIREPIFTDRPAQKGRPVMMGRIVHLAKFVEKLRFPVPFSICVWITDDCIPENNGCFQIEIDSSAGSIKRAAASRAAESMDIAEFGQLLFDRMKIFVNEVV